MQKIYNYGILLFAFSLPIFESPKHIGFSMMVIGFLGMVLFEKSINISKPDVIEWLLIAILLTSILSSLLNWPLIKGIKGTKHTVYFLCTFWVLYKGKHRESFLSLIPIALILGTLIGLFWAEYNLLYSSETELMFNSINSFTRSGGFNATILFVCAGVIIDNTSDFKLKNKFFFIISLIIVSLFSLMMGGRGPLLSIIATYLLLLRPLVNYKKYLQLLIVQVIIVIISAIVLQFFSNTRGVGRFQHLLSTELSFEMSEMAEGDQLRYDFWRIGIAQAIQNPSFFGVGPDNFSAVKIEDLYFDKPLLKGKETLINSAPHHSHNWIITRWVETGIVGISAFLLFIAHLLYTLWKNRPTNNSTRVNWVWVASFSALTIASISGLFNSSFTHENGWLTFFLMAIGAAYSKQNSGDQPQDIKNAH